MCTVISSDKISGSRKIGDLYFKGEYTRSNDCVIVFRGQFYPETKLTVNDVVKAIINGQNNVLMELGGKFFFIIYDIYENKLYVFNDRYGMKHLYLYHKNGDFSISDSFNAILNQFEIGFGDIEKQAIFEFLIFGYPLFGKTFIKQIQYIPLASFIVIDVKHRNINQTQYWDYCFQIEKNIDEKEALSKLNLLFLQSITRIKGMNENNSVFGLGLSGGIDSRVVAYFAQKVGLRLKTFIFGERNSDAYFISRKIAQKINLDHSELDVDKNFIKYSKESVNYNPMMNLLYTWYYSIHERLPRFDVLLTGFNGDNQFGSHLTSDDKKINNENQLVNRIISKYDGRNFIKTSSMVIKDQNCKFRLVNDMKKFIKRSKNKEPWQIKEQFNYEFRQRYFIKNNPAFNFLGKFDFFSPFCDFDLLDFLMTIPFQYRVNCKLYFSFLRKYCPNISGIRPERRPYSIMTPGWQKPIKRALFYINLKLNLGFFYRRSHKIVQNWIKNNQFFDEYIKDTFSHENSFFSEIFDLIQVNQILTSYKNSSHSSSFLFRILTIKMFLDELINSSGPQSNDKS